MSWLNPAAFAVPALGTFGNMNPNDLVGPSYWEWDQTIARQFRITDRHRLEVRAEAYNLTNSLRLGLPGTTFTGTEVSAFVYS